MGFVSPKRNNTAVSMYPNAVSRHTPNSNRERANPATTNPIRRRSEHDDAPASGRCLFAGPYPVAHKGFLPKRLGPLLKRLCGLATDDDLLGLLAPQGIADIFLPLSRDLGNRLADCGLKHRADLINR